MRKCVVWASSINLDAIAVHGNVMVMEQKFNFSIMKSSAGELVEMNKKVNLQLNRIICKFSSITVE